MDKYCVNCRWHSKHERRNLGGCHGYPVDWCERPFRADPVTGKAASETMCNYERYSVVGCGPEAK